MFDHVHARSYFSHLRLLTTATPRDAQAVSGWTGVASAGGGGLCNSGVLTCLTCVIHGNTAQTGAGVLTRLSVLT